jgi:diacylglycerol kinase (ATP)
MIMKSKLKPATIEFDDEEPHDVQLINAFIGNCIYNGGGIRAAYKAVPDDGLLDVTIIEGIKKKGVLISTLLGFYKDEATVEGLIKKLDPHLFYGRHKKVRITTKEKEILVEFDGEVLGKTPLDIEIVPAALNVLVP